MLPHSSASSDWPVARHTTVSIACFVLPSLEVQSLRLALLQVGDDQLSQMLRKRRQLDVHLAEASALLERYSQVFSRDFAHILIHRPFPPFTQSPPWCEAAVPDHAGGTRRSGRIAGNSTAGDMSGSLLQSVFRCLFLQLQSRDGSGFACNGITELQAAHRCNLCYHS